MNSEQAEIHALQLHMSRIFENPKWVLLDKWNVILNKNTKSVPEYEQLLLVNF